MTEDIIHNEDKKRFEFKKETDLAVCEYEKKGDVWSFHHTFVPDSMRGMGIAGKLVNKALNHVAGQKGKVVPQCSYVADYIKKHEEFKKLLTLF